MAAEFDRGRERSASSLGTEFDFGGVRERIVTRDDFSLERARQVLKDEIIAVIGYGVQGPAQALNLRDNGFRVIVGQRKGPTFEKAVTDGWEPDKTLFSIEDAARQGTQVQYLLSDAAQKELWGQIRPLLKPGDALYFSHGFSYVFRDQTGIVPPVDVDVILVAPKGAGRSVREHFLTGRGINASFAVAQDATGRAQERAMATGMAIGSGFLFPTTFENEVYSDLTGERGVLMGAFYGLVEAAFDNLRQRELSPYDAALHSVEIATQTIAKIIGEGGADGLLKELPDEWSDHFANGFVAAVEATTGTFGQLYENVRDGVETRRVIEANSKPDYREVLNVELAEIAQSELGRAATEVRERRAQGRVVSEKIQNDLDAILAGALVGIFHAQYDLLRERGHAPSEAFNETVEEATQSLYPLIDMRGIDWMYANCSTTAQRGALDWHGRFRDVLAGRLSVVYKGNFMPASGVSGLIWESGMWKAGKTVRELRPENQRIS